MSAKGSLSASPMRRERRVSSRPAVTRASQETAGPAARGGAPARDQTPPPAAAPTRPDRETVTPPTPDSASTRPRAAHAPDTSGSPAPPHHRAWQGAASHATARTARSTARRPAWCADCSGARQPGHEPPSKGVRKTCRTLHAPSRPVVITPSRAASWQRTTRTAICDATPTRAPPAHPHAPARRWLCNER